MTTFQAVNVEVNLGDWKKEKKRERDPQLDDRILNVSIVQDVSPGVEQRHIKFKSPSASSASPLKRAE